MIAILERLSRGARAAALALALPGAAYAACSEIAALDARAPEGVDIGAVQRGLRAALQDDDPRLQDRLFGRYTRAALERLCLAVPRAGSVPDIPGTLALAEDYDRLSALMPLWPETVLAEGFLAALLPENTGAPNPVLLRLAATPPMIAGVLMATSIRPDCGVIDTLDLTPTAAKGAETLMRITGATSLESLCRAFPVDGDLDDFGAALAALGSIEAARPGALQVLQSPGFGTWLAAGPSERVLALLGTDDAVLHLVDAYLAETPAETDTPPPLPASCGIPPENGVLTYMSFGQRQLDLLTDRVDLDAALAPVAESSFVTADAQWKALRVALSTVFDACALDQAQALTLGPDRPGEMFTLDPGKVAAFKLDPMLSAREPLVAPLIGIVAPRREDLRAGIETALATALRAALDAEIELAAATAAGAAEPVEDVRDVPRVDEAQFDQLDLPPLIGVTDASMIAVLETLTNDAFKAELEAGPFMVATNPDLIKGDVRALLRPLVEGQVTEGVAADMALIDGAIAPVWRLTPELRGGIDRIARFSGALDDPTAAELATRMRSLVGLQYPTRRLFGAALADVPPAQSAQGVTIEPNLSEALIERATALALTRVPDPAEPRVTAQLASDCGCVPERVDQDTNVYGFYPFWLSPVKPTATPAPPADPADPAADPAPDAADAPPPGPEPIDFGLLSQVAFYGLEFAYEFPGKPVGERNLRLENVGHWTDMKRDFVTSAHRHRAKADLAFEMRGWSDWTDTEIADAVERIDTQSQPFTRFRTLSWQGLREALPTLFDPARVDGVTLIFEDYDGRPDSQLNVGKMVTLIEQVQNRLSERGQSVNVAFDFALIDVGGRQELMNDLRELLIRGRDKEKTIDKILVFLERPTTETKKRLRSRMERGDFRGAERSEVLRSIIPVLPPAGHEFVEQRPLPGEGPDPARQKFSQFADDVVYFRDNFAGIGFWPIPLLDGPETARLSGILSAEWNRHKPDADFATLRARSAAVCTWACPNRAYLTLAAMALFALVALLTWRSFYSGTVDYIAFRLGAVWVGTAVVVALLFVLTRCDFRAFWPPLLLYALVAMLAAIMLFDIIQRARNGPKP